MICCCSSDSRLLSGFGAARSDMGSVGIVETVGLADSSANALMRAALAALAFSASHPMQWSKPHR